MFENREHALAETNRHLERQVHDLQERLAIYEGRMPLDLHSVMKPGMELRDLLMYLHGAGMVITRVDSRIEAEAIPTLGGRTHTLPVKLHVELEAILPYSRGR